MCYLGGFVPSVILQGLIQVAVGARAFPFAHIKYSINKCLETLLWGHGVTAERQVFRHSGKERKKNIFRYISIL